MTDRSKNKQRIQSTVSVNTHQTIKELAEAKAISKGKTIDLIVSQWLNHDSKADATCGQLGHDISVIKDMIQSLTARLSRIEQNIMTRDAVDAE